MAGGCIGQTSQGRRASFALEAELGCRGREMTVEEKSTGRLSVGLEGGGTCQSAKLHRNLGLEVAPRKMGPARLLSRLGPDCCMSACLTRHSRAPEYDQDN